MDMPSLAHQALAALAVPSQHARLIRLDAPVPGLVVERFEGTEAVCAAFRFEVDVLSTSAFIDAAELLGQPLALGLARAGGEARRWHGLCTAVAPLGGDGGLARYRLLIEPWTALLTHRRNALVFQDLDVRGVLEQLFADYPQADWRFDVSRELPVRPVTTQYRESDWDFATRLLAETGLAWRYEHAQGGDDDDRNGPGHALVIFDQQAAPAEGRALRFHRIDATERDDAISTFSVRHQVVPSRSQVGSWQSGQLTSLAGVAEGDAGGAPPLEVYMQPRDGRFSGGEQARGEAGHRLDALRLPRHLYTGAGSVRDLRPGSTYTLRQHPVHEGAEFVPLNIVHVAVNNLGNGITALLGSPDLERGSYRGRFVAVPAGTPIAPLPRPRPTACGPQTARVVGLPDAAVTSSRDHQARIQFAWQRGPAPSPGGLVETASSHPGHAPGDATSGTWVPVAEWLSGPNWGSHFLPRIGAEVLVEFAHGDIDQPRITGQLFNGEVAPPFGGGVDGVSNHPGTLSGLHSQSHDGDGSQQWVVDDTPGQLRTRLHTSLADSRLELGYLIDHGDTQRGGLRGEGVELATLGWGNVHAAQGLLLSTTARPDGASTQLDIAEAVAQLKGAERTAGALDETLRQQEVPGLGGNEQLSALRESIDPEEQGCHRGTVAGQGAMKPASGRDPGEDPVERFANPGLIAESPESIAFATRKSAVAHAGGTLHLTAQADAQLTAAHTVSSVSGQHAALYAHAGPIRAIAANGPLSLQAHTGELELLADQSVSVTATDDRIDVLAAEKIVLQAGQTRVTLEGGDITFECPGNFTVKGAQGPFKGGAVARVAATALPIKLASDLISCPWRKGGSEIDPSAEGASLPQPLRSDSASENGAENPHFQITSAQTEVPALSSCTPNLAEHATTDHTVCLSGDYLQTDEHGAMVKDEEGQPILLPYSRAGGTYDLLFRPDERRIVLTLRVNVLAKDWIELDPLTGQIRADPDTGEPISWPFSHDNADLVRNGALPLKQVDRHGDIDLGRVQSQIDNTLKSNQYFLEPAGCAQGNGCACRIPIELKLDLATSHNSPHATVNLFPATERANSKNLGEVTVIPNNDMSGPTWIPVPGPDHVGAHEAGHWFGWPDEYFVGGGAVHKQYIGDDLLVDIRMVEPPEDWKRYSPTNLMGGGVFLASPLIPDYYMHSIRDWFDAQTGLEWRVSA